MSQSFRATLKRRAIGCDNTVHGPGKLLYRFTTVFNSSPPRSDGKENSLIPLRYFL